MPVSMRIFKQENPLACVDNAWNQTCYGGFKKYNTKIYFFSGQRLMTHLFWSSRWSSMKAERYLPTPLGKMLVFWSFSQPSKHRQLQQDPAVFSRLLHPLSPATSSANELLYLCSFQIKPFPCSGKLVWMQSSTTSSKRTGKPTPGLSSSPNVTSWLQHWS